MHIHKRLVIAFAAASLMTGIAHAVPLNPNDFTSLGALPGGNFSLDTDAGGGVIVSQGASLPDIAVFTYDGGSVFGSGNTLTVTGSNAFALLFKGSATISGTIDVSGATPSNSSSGAAGVAGGGRGGNSSVFNGVADFGEGPGAGQEGSTSASISGAGSGSGGGFGTAGGPGGAGITFRAGGAAYGDLLVSLEAGSGGGGAGGHNAGSSNGGGSGGGAIEIGALIDLDFLGATILTNGGDGGSDGFGSGIGAGGGSGGGLLIHGFNVNIDGSSLLQANGGDGGDTGGFRVIGGCGGAGRIAILYNTAGSLNNSGTVEAVSGVGKDACDTTTITVATEALTDIGEPPVTDPPINVPEPATLAILALGLAGLSLPWRRKPT